MAKRSGLGNEAYYQGIDVSGDVSAITNASGGPAALEVTGINKSAVERIGGVRDGSFGFTSWFNDGAGADRAGAAGSSFHELSKLPTTDVHLMYVVDPAIGGPAACMVAKQVDHNGSRAQDGAFPFTVQALANAYGLEWCDMLTAGKRTDTAATNGASLDLGAAKSNGLQAYLQVTAFSGTDVTVKLQGSSDDGGGDAFADITGGGFTQITSAPTYERIATAAGQAVERYIRAVTVTTGGVTSVTYAVAVAVNETAVVF